MICPCKKAECKQCVDEKGLCRTKDEIYMVAGFKKCPWTMRNPVRTELKYRGRK